MIPPEDMLLQLTPKHIDEFLDNNDAKQSIQMFFQQEGASSLLLIGPSGCGKTTLCNILLSSYQHSICVLKPSFEDYSTHKEFVSTVEKFINMKNLQEIFLKKTKLLFLDDIDVLLTTDRYANTFIQDILKRSKTSSTHFKVLMTCTQGNEKRVTDIKKKTIFSYIHNPRVDLVVDKLFSFVPDTNRDVLLSFVKSYNGNIRCCIMNLSAVYNTTEKNCNFEHNTIRAIVFDKNITDIVAGVMNAPTWTVKQLSIWLSVDPCLVSYILYDNAIQYLEPRSVYRIVETFARASIIETVLYQRNDQLLCDTCNIWRCGNIKESLPTNFKLKPLKYTTIPTRSANYYNSVKKNNIACSDYWLSRNEILNISYIGILQDASTHNFIKKLIDMR